MSVCVCVSARVLYIYLYADRDIFYGALRLCNNSLAVHYQKVFIFICSRTECVCVRALCCIYLAVYNSTQHICARLLPAQLRKVLWPF